MIDFITGIFVLFHNSLDVVVALDMVPISTLICRSSSIFVDNFPALLFYHHTIAIFALDYSYNFVFVVTVVDRASFDYPKAVFDMILIFFLNYMIIFTSVDIMVSVTPFWFIFYMIFILILHIDHTFALSCSISHLRFSSMSFPVYLLQTA